VLVPWACAPAGRLSSPWPGPGAVESGLEVKAEERFYSVSGTSASALNLSLSLRGPRHGGRAAHAITVWRLDWSYVPTRRSSTCASGRPRVVVDVVTTLPRWEDLEVASEGLAKDWAIFQERLRRHESGHREIAVRTGRELLSTLGDLRAQDCDRLAQEARRLAQQLASGHQDLKRRFDQATDYGRLLPPR